MDDRTSVNSRPHDCLPEIADLIEKYAGMYEIPAGLLFAQVRQESSFKPTAVSSCGARGLMQLMPATGRDMGLLTDEDFFNPEKNLNAGCKYLKIQRRAVMKAIITLAATRNSCTADDYWKLALAAYNGGLGYVLKAISICVVDRHEICWASVASILSDKREVVHGHDPEEWQMRDYVARIWAHYEGEGSGGAV